MKFAKWIGIAAVLSSIGPAVEHSFARQDGPADLVIQGAWILDPRTQSQAKGDVVIRGGKITAVLKGASKTHARKVIQAQGRWLIPGLHDMHVHPWRGNFSPSDQFDSRYDDVATAQQVGYRMLDAGITTYLDLASPSPFGDQPENRVTRGSNVFDLRKKQRSGQIVSPRIFAAGPIWAVPGSHSVMIPLPNLFKAIQVKDAQGRPLPESQVTPWVQKQLSQFITDAQPDIIKLVYNNHEDLPSNRPEKMPLYVAKEIVRTANAKGVKSIAHLGTWKAVGELAQAGISAFTHLPHGRAPAEVIQALLEAHTVAVTTMAVYEDLGDMKDPAKSLAYLEDPLFKEVTPLPFASTLVDYSKYSAADKAWADWGQKHSDLRDQENALMSLTSGGVTVLPGTDALNTGAIFGYTLHRELLRWEAAGVSRWEILKAATWSSSQFLGQHAGAIAPGFDADLVLLRGNPLESIANTQLIDAVIIAGKTFDRDQYATQMVTSGQSGDAAK